MITRRHIARVLPLVDRELAQWSERARSIPDPALAAQATASIAHKRFHCEGGSVFAAWSKDGPGAEGAALVRFIVALQTISDYLDNLGDRTGSLDPRDFRQLHQAMLDAVSPGTAPAGDYYRFHPHQDDGGYLDALVGTCREVLSSLPRYETVRLRVTRLVRLYTDLQCYKHAEPDQRVPALQAWFDRHSSGYPGLKWWEFAAACGSTLGVFALVAEAARSIPVEAKERLEAAYFPWIAGVHILLDYFIDQEEDRRENDLNFVSFYSSASEAAGRMGWLLGQALHHARGLADPPFHLTVIEGLLGLYLSNPKVREQGIEGVARELLARGGVRARIVHAYCRHFFWRSARGV